MKQENYTTRVLRADEGHVLTQAADVAPFDRIITDTVYLAANDAPANWREITNEEAEACQAEKEAAIAAAGFTESGNSEEPCGK